MPKKISELSRSEHIQHHEQWLQPLLHAVDLLEYLENHDDSALAQLDFHLLMPYLFSVAGKGSKPMYGHVREWFPDVLKNQEKMQLSFVITGPTFLEFLDQLKHQSDAAEAVLTQHIDRIDLELEALDERAFANTKKILDWLSILTDEGFENIIRKPIVEMKRLFDKRLLRGVGDFDFLPEKGIWKRYHTICNNIFEGQCRLRLVRDRAKRSDRDSRFHYRVDAANMCISKIIQQEAHRDLFFFTRTQSAINSLAGLGKHDQTLPVLLRLTRLEQSSDDRILRLRDAISFVTENLAFIRSKNTIADFPNFLFERIHHFYKCLMPQLFVTEGKRNRNIMQADMDEIRKLVSNRHKLSACIDRAVEEIRAGGRDLVNQLGETVQLEMWEDFNLQEDPVYQKLRKHFSLA